MNRILSILIALAMLLTGVCFAETAAEDVSAALTVRDVVLTVNGEEYALNPSLVLGLVTEGENALIDIGMPVGEDVLFPIQMKYDESGLGLMLGDPNTAHLLSAALIESLTGGVQMDDSATEMMEAYTRMLEAAAEMEKDETAVNEAVDAWFEEQLANVPATEMPFSLDGTEEILGEHIVFTLDHAQVMELMDLTFSGEFGEAYFDYLSATMASSGMEGEINSFADMFEMIGMTMSIDIDAVGKDEQGIIDMFMNFTIDPNAMVVETYEGVEAEAEEVEPITFSIPISVTIYDENNSYISVMIAEIDPEAFPAEMAIYIHQYFEDMTMDLSMTIEDVTMQCSASVTNNEDESVTTVCNFDLEVPSEDVHVICSLSDVTQSDMITSTATLDLEVYEGEEMPFGLSLAIDTGAAEIADRFEGAAVETYNAMEEIENSQNLMLAVMAMAGDLEKLMSDESVAALIELFTGVVDVDYGVSVIGGADGPTEIITTPVASENANPEIAAELSFELPEFTYLPEGYVLEDSYIDAEYDYASLTFEYTGEGEYRSLLFIDIAPAEGEVYALTTDGAALAHPTIIVERSEDEIHAEAVVNGLAIALYYYDDLPDAEIAAIFGGCQ